MNDGSRIAHPIEILFGSGVALACGLDGQVLAGQLHGLFAGDTRVLSTYRIGINGHPWIFLSRTRPSAATAAWVFHSPRLRTPRADIEESELLLTLHREVNGYLHDELRLRTFLEAEAQVRFSFQLDADFADIFQVKDQTLPPHLAVARFRTEDGLQLRYARSRFSRGLRLHFHASSGNLVHSGGLILFDLHVKPGEEWVCSLDAIPEVNGEATTSWAKSANSRSGSERESPHITAPHPVESVWKQSSSDLDALAMPQQDGSAYVAAGAPWFLTLFGRDTLVTSLMAGLAGSWLAEGALQALSDRQASERDDWRDAEPGKFPHEIRVGELAHTGEIPHAAYYGTHDAPALYCLALWQAWRWTGKRELLDRYLPHALSALRWCSEFGDRDQDGLQEYATRSTRGYYNQSWKDAGDAIVTATGAIARTPLATVELQGYFFAAQLAVAELLEAIGHLKEALRLRTAAIKLREFVEASYWMDEAGFYAVALDGSKLPVRSIQSNPGHLLWCGLPSAERAMKVARRFLQPDMFSGWGLRTLSSRNPAYNPLLYQRGSVWPFDTALAAAGLWRYGLYDGADRLLGGVFEACSYFEQDRLPELFCGLDRAEGPPVPYEKANVPQAWSAAVPFLAVQLFLGLQPDAPNSRCYLTPRLPVWLPQLEVHNIRIGNGRLSVSLVQVNGRTEIQNLEASGVEVIRQQPSAPLWGAAFGTIK